MCLHIFLMLLLSLSSFIRRRMGFAPYRGCHRQPIRLRINDDSENRSIRNTSKLAFLILTTSVKMELPADSTTRALLWSGLRQHHDNIYPSEDEFVELFNKRMWLRNDVATWRLYRMVLRRFKLDTSLRKQIVLKNVLQDLYEESRTQRKLRFSSDEF